MPVDLDDRLVLRPVQSEADAARFIALNEAVTGEGSICMRLLGHRPETQWSDFVLAEDLDSGRAVSTTCLLPWKCRLEGVTLRAAMLEMVVTDPQYRRRGLVRAQIQRFQREVAARGFDFSIIQGIPFYYRQYGYGYALDHTRCDRLPPGSLPAAQAEYRLRAASQADVPGLARLYQQNMGLNRLYVLRSPEDWGYLLAHAGCPLQVLELAADGHMAAYASLRPRPGGPLLVEESAIAGRDAGLGLLGLLARAQGLEIAGSPAHPLVRLARELGSQALPCSQWLLHLHDPAAFLLKLAPVFEARLAQSALAGLDAGLTLNFYRQALRLRFKDGKLEEVAPAGFIDSSLGADGGDLCIPPDAFLRLVFGYRGLDELADAWPDTQVSQAARPIWEVLFPRMDAWILMPD